MTLYIHPHHHTTFSIHTLLDVSFWLVVYDIVLLRICIFTVCSYICAVCCMCVIFVHSRTLIYVASAFAAIVLMLMCVPSCLLVSCALTLLLLTFDLDS
jgi:hypothetical protein